VLGISGSFGGTRFAIPSFVSTNYHFDYGTRVPSERPWIHPGLHAVNRSAQLRTSTLLQHRQRPHAVGSIEWLGSSDRRRAM
jgi:hypothetical protein